MALNKLMPIPSDRMGLIWNLLSIPDAFVLEYGPAGTTHFGLGPISSLKLEPRGRYFVTHMDEKDVVMGDTERLEKAVLEIAEDYQAKELFIIGSSVSSTIGTDLQGITHYLQDQVETHLHVYDGGGFRGNYLDGTKQFYEYLAEIVRNQSDEEIALVQAKMPEHVFPFARSYNILGAAPDHFRLQSDLQEIERVLSTALSALRFSTYGFSGSIRNLALAGRAAVNLLIRPEALPLAEAMKERYGQEFMEINCYGYEGTKATVEALAEKLKVNIEDKFLEHLRERQGRLAMLPYALSAASRAPHVLIIANPALQKGLTQVMSEFGITDCQLCSSCADEKERLEALNACEQSLVCADSASLHALKPGNRKLLTSFPWLKRNLVAEHLPFMGTRGMDFLAEYVLDYIDSL